VSTAALPGEAWALLTEWLPGNEDVDRPQITLGTLDEHGAPDLRTVLLTSFDERGFVVNTDSASRKVAQLAADDRVAIAVLWPGFTHQLTVQGRAVPLPPDELAAAYAARSPYLQQLAWQNTHAFAALPLEERRATWAAFATEHRDGFPVSPTWTGYRIVPTRLTFWSSAPDTASSRVEFALGPDGAWTRSVLPG
jgi:pyridoxamine 5'-phosphate oxidase